MSEEDLKRIECAFAPGEGACGGMYTANTMASVAEALGLSLPGSAAPPAADRRRDYFAHRSGEAVVNLLRQGITTKDILTKESFENAIALVMALGGSTNVVLHLLAIANEAGIELSLHDFNRIGSRTPHVADMKPFGKYVMNDVDRHGGIPVIMKAMLDEGLIHGDALTVTGKTVAENLRDLNPDPVDGDVIHTFDNPIHASGGITILHGSLAPEGAVVKSRFRRGRVRGSGARVRARARGDGCAGGRRDQRRRRHRDPLRGAQGRSGHARDARHHRGHQGRGSRKRCTTVDGRTILRRHNRPVHRPHSTRSRGRRSHRLRARW